ncbi:Oidioi.mRNA.OKI2018_I69.chr1.g2863.t1.cds [Oikopleura dioica]|uniref:Oidioi.mRNA.OKI2018_I69.chr1.g2863.t1.cds n=1 Tax=Oikopleura dioica TaxID=34765 RepID=A0ABN7SWA3_OIKDI|nr:Oidioi.mRNA.OKI2018_I69.chr1.g2863.t1.cds [Oikopleura dioica]
MFQHLNFDQLQQISAKSKRARILKSNFNHHVIKTKEQYYIKASIAELVDAEGEEKFGIEKLELNKTATFALIENNFNLDCPKTRNWFKKEVPEALRRENTLIVSIYEYQPQAEEYKGKYITDPESQIDGRFVICGLKCPSI